MFQNITNIVGTEKASNDLIKRLSTTDDTAKMLKMVGVLGFGGLGKTTLAKVVFGRLKNQFACSCFFPVGQKPNMKKVFKAICTELKMTVEAELEEWQLIDRLRNFLSVEKKRYVRHELHTKLNATHHIRLLFGEYFFILLVGIYTSNCSASSFLCALSQQMHCCLDLIP
jgi:translation initiation factor RLI1